MGTKLKFWTTFHPQIDGQTEVVNRTLENFFRCLVGENLKTWDLILPMTEFAYNSSVNRTTCFSLFEIVTRFNSRQPIDLVPMVIIILGYQTPHRHSYLIYLHYTRKSEKNNEK